MAAARNGLVERRAGGIFSWTNRAPGNTRDGGLCRLALDDHVLRVGRRQEGGTRTYYPVCGADLGSK